MTTETRLLTVDEFAALPEPEDGSRQELLVGEVCTMPPAAGMHGRIAGRLSLALGTFVAAHDIGDLYVASGFVLERAPDTTLAPDVAIALRERELRGEPYPEGGPDLAVEVVSPSERAGRLNRKVQAYFAAGCRRVWLVYPEQRSVTVHRPHGHAHTHDALATLTSDDAGFPLEGFRLQVESLFDLQRERREG